MFETLLSGLLNGLFNLFQWSWRHPDLAGLVLSGTAFFLLVWLHVPKRLEYYWQNGKVTVQPFNVRNEIPQYVRGRIAVLQFCRKHKLKLDIGRRIRRNIAEFLLSLIGIPHPRVFAWEGSYFAMMFYPLGRTRREFVRLCIRLRICPWQRQRIEQVLDANKGRWPGIEAETFLAAFSNRLYN